MSRAIYSGAELILQLFFRFSYVTGSSLTSPGEPPMLQFSGMYLSYTDSLNLRISDPLMKAMGEIEVILVKKKTHFHFIA